MGLEPCGSLLMSYKVPVMGYVSVDKHEPARRVVEGHYPGVLHYSDVQEISEETIKQWSAQFTQVSLVIIGAGPPCQGVSGLNCDRKGALRDERSCLFAEVPRIRDQVKQSFPWCPVYVLMESVASMDTQDRNITSESIGCQPIRCDAGSFTWCHRPRLYWCEWEILEGDGVSLTTCEDSPTVLSLVGSQCFEQVVRTGWLKVNPEKPFPTFTTSRPRTSPGRKPAGIQNCTWEELRRWEADSYRFPPYQYCQDHCLVNRQGCLRVPDVAERDMMLGFPLGIPAGVSLNNGEVTTVTPTADSPF